MSDYPWASSLKASIHLGVTEKTLNHWREIGYLKYGTHWRNSVSIATTPRTSEVVYQVNWCKEEMEYWRSHNAIIEGLVV